MRKKKIETSPPQVPVHKVTRREWDDTMRAALAGLIANGDRFGTYANAVAHARVYAQAAHGDRP